MISVRHPLGTGMSARAQMLPYSIYSLRIPHVLRALFDIHMLERLFLHRGFPWVLWLTTCKQPEQFSRFTELGPVPSPCQERRTTPHGTTAPNPKRTALLHRTHTWTAKARGKLAFRSNSPKFRLLWRWGGGSFSDVQPTLFQSNYIFNFCRHLRTHSPGLTHIKVSLRQLATHRTQVACLAPTK